MELLNPQVPPSKSHRILRGSSSRPLNKEYIEDRLTTRGCRLEGGGVEGSPPATIRAVSSAQWSLVVTTTKAEEFELGLVTSRQCFSLQSIFLIYRNFPEQLPTTFSCSPILADTLEPLREALKTLMKSTVTRIQYIKVLPRGAAAKVRCRTRW